MNTTINAVCTNQLCRSSHTNSSVAIVDKKLELTSQCLDCGTEWIEQFRTTNNNIVTKQGVQPTVVQFKVIEVDDLCANIQHTEYFTSSLRLALSNIGFRLSRDQSNRHSHKSPSDPEWDNAGVRWYDEEGGNDKKLEAALTTLVNHQLCKLTESLHNFSVTIVDGCETGAYLRLTAPHINGELIILVETSLTSEPNDEVVDANQFNLFDWMDMFPAESLYSYESLLTIPLLTKYFDLETAIGLRAKAEVVLAEFFTDAFAEEYNISYELADELINYHQGEILQYDGYWVVNSFELLGLDTTSLIKQYLQIRSTKAQ